MSVPRELVTVPAPGATSHSWLNIRTLAVDDPHAAYAAHLFAILDVEVGRPERFLSALSTSPYPVVSALRELVRDTLISERRALAQDFARRVAERAHVREVWLNSVEPEFVVSVVASDLDLQRDLELRAVFIDLLRLTGDVSVGDLDIYPESEGVPEDARSGTKLL